MRKEIDWEVIERDYRAGIMSVREIAAKNGITHTTINKKAKNEQWSRDLKARIQAKAEMLVSKGQVSKIRSVESLANDKLVVDENARIVADVHMGQRKMVGRINEYVNKLIDRLNSAENEEEELPRAVDTAKKLSETLRMVIGMERDVYGMSGPIDVEIKVKGLRDFYGE